MAETEEAKVTAAKGGGCCHYYQRCPRRGQRKATLEMADHSPQSSDSMCEICPWLGRRHYYRCSHNFRLDAAVKGEDG